MNKKKKIIKRTVTYIDYGNGLRSLKENLPYEVKRWIAQDYVMKLFNKTRPDKLEE